MINETLIKIVAISALTQCAILTIIACLYYKAYNEMKRAPIIGWIAVTAGTGAVVGLFTGLTSLFPSNILARLLVASRVALSYAGIMFIRASLAPNNKELEELKSPIKDTKKGKDSR